MSRETRMAIEHSTPMPQRSESGVSALTKPKFSRFGIGKRGTKLTPSPMKLPGTAALAELQSLLTAQFCLRVFECPCKVEG